MNNHPPSAWHQQAAQAASELKAKNAARAGASLQPTKHHMGRRCFVHDYSMPGYYHITLKADAAFGPIFGHIAGNAEVAEGQPDAPRVILSPIGQMVEQELQHSISQHYPMVEVQDHVVMPEHLHIILRVKEPLVSKAGKPQHLSRVIAGFKYGCALRYHQLTESADAAPTDPTQPTGPSSATGTTHPIDASPATDAAQPTGASRFHREASSSLFAPGYVDVMPLEAGQLQKQRDYIRSNPRQRLLRTQCHLRTERGGIDTALSIEALFGYLRRECCPYQASPEILTGLQSLLLTTAPSAPAASAPSAPCASTGSTPTSSAPCAPAASAPASSAPCASAARPTITCDTYGPRALLARPLFPVVCHRSHAALFEQQKAACLQAAASGTVLVSARISKGEQDIMDAAIAAGYPVILIEDNGFPEVYHPSAERTQRCVAGLLLLITPWQYHYRHADDSIHVAYCKTMNCLAQALCRTKDDWWRQPTST